MNALKKNLQVDWRNTSVWSLKYLSVLPPSAHHLASELQKREELHENMLTKFLANFKQLLKLHNFDPLYYWWTCFFCNSVLSHDPQRNSPDLRGCFCKHNRHRHWIFPKGASLHYGFCGNKRERLFSWGNLLNSWMLNFSLISYLCKYLLEISIKIIFKVGGLMGLWLGLGVVQALQVLADTLSPLFGIFKEGKSTLA